MPNNNYKSFVNQVPVFTPRGAAVHIDLGGREVSAMPVAVFLAAADAAAAVAAELRARRPVLLHHRKTKG